MAVVAGGERVALRVARVAASLPLAVATGVLIGWALRIQALKSIVPGLVNMNPVTAVGFLLAGTSLLLLLDPRPSRWAAGRALAVPVLLLGALRLWTYLTGMDVGQDAWLFHDDVMAVPGHNAIAPNTAFNFFLGGWALLMLRSASAPVVRLALGFALGAVAVATLTVLGYLFGVREFYGFLSFFPMALHTGISFVALGTGLVAARPDAGLVRVLLADDDGGRLARRLLPVAIATPILLGAVRLQGERMGLYASNFGVALFAVTLSLVMGLVVAVQARSTSRADQARRQAEWELDAARQRAEAGEKAALLAARNKADFLASMSHEIRTPLNGMVGMARLLADTGLEGRQQEYANTIRASGEHLAAVVNDVLDISKVDAGRLELEDRPFALREALEECVAIVRPAALAKGLALGLEVAPGLPEALHGDVLRLRQVVVNLLSNAVKFTERGQVIVRAEAQGEVLRISVQDTGIGIPADRMGRLFQPFSQGDASTARTHGGTGLGLAISRRLAEAMAGRIEVESVPGDGSTFRLVLPLRPAAAATLPPAPPKEVGPLPPLRILLVEDNRINQAVALRMLERLGLAADVAEDGPQAVAAATVGGYDVILMDVHLPGMDGFTATRQIRARLATARQPRILALTADDLPRHGDALQSAGLDGAVAKPFDLRTLAQALAPSAPPPDDARPARA